MKNLFFAMPTRVMEKSNKSIFSSSSGVDSKLCRPQLEAAGVARISIRKFKHRDIPHLLKNRSVDFGISCDEWLLETAVEHEIIATHRHYSTRLCLIGREDVTMSGEQPANSSIRVVTEFPRCAQLLFLHCSKLNCGMTVIFGSTESYIPDFADIGIDCVETGRTLNEHGLVVLRVLMECKLRLVVLRSRKDELRGVASSLRPLFSEDWIFSE